MTKQRNSESRAHGGGTRRRKDRANVASRLQGVYLKCEQLIPKRELRVFNISELGVGVDAELLEHAPDENTIWDAKLLVGTTVAPVKVRLARWDRQLMGLEFVGPSDLLRGAIRGFFEPELAGASLRPSDGSTGKKRRYESRDGSLLELQVSSPGVVEKFTVNVLGNRVSWDAKGGLKLIQNEQTEVVPEFLLKQLVKLARSAEAVESELRSQVEAVLVGTYGIGAR